MVLSAAEALLSIASEFAVGVGPCLAVVGAREARWRRITECSRWWGWVRRWMYTYPVDGSTSGGRRHITSRHGRRAAPKK